MSLPPSAQHLQGGRSGALVLPTDQGCMIDCHLTHRNRRGRSRGRGLRWRRCASHCWGSRGLHRRRPRGRSTSGSRRASARGTGTRRTSTSSRRTGASAHGLMDHVHRKKRWSERRVLSVNHSHQIRARHRLVVTTENLLMDAELQGARPGDACCCCVNHNEKPVASPLRNTGPGKPPKCSWSAATGSMTTAGTAESIPRPCFSYVVAARALSTGDASVSKTWMF